MMSIQDFLKVSVFLGIIRYFRLFFVKEMLSLLNKTPFDLKSQRVF